MHRCFTATGYKAAIQIQEAVTVYVIQRTTFSGSAFRFNFKLTEHQGIHVDIGYVEVSRPENGDEGVIQAIQIASRFDVNGYRFDNGGSIDL